MSVPSPSPDLNFSAWPFAKLSDSQKTLRSKVAQSEQDRDVLCRARDAAKGAVDRHERALIAEHGSVPANDAELQRLRDTHDVAKQAVENHHNEVERVAEVLKAVNAELHQRALRLDGEIQQRCINAQRGRWPDAKRAAQEAFVAAIKAQYWGEHTSNPETCDLELFLKHYAALDIAAINKLLRESVAADRAKAKADAILLSYGMLLGE